MDETLIKLLKSREGKKQMELNHESETVSLVDEFGVAGTPHPVMPLLQLYGNGTGRESVEFDDNLFLPLLLAIEEAIWDSYTAHPALTDGIVLAALDRLCMTPEADVHNDPLAVTIQFALRVTLSVSDFSRQDVRHCLRKVKQSVSRHNKLGGTRGYLEFIKKALTPQER